MAKKDLNEWSGIDNVVQFEGDLCGEHRAGTPICFQKSSQTFGSLVGNA